MEGYEQVWFLGENANYAAAEYAWESTTSPSTALMMLDGDKMVAAASSRNPTLAGAVSRLERCAISGSWEVCVAFGLSWLCLKILLTPEVVILMLFNHVQCVFINHFVQLSSSLCSMCTRYELSQHRHL